MLIIALQWVANKLAKIGLLPDFIVKRLGLLAAAGGGRGSEQGKQDGCDAGCCAGGGSGESRRRGKRSDTVTTASSSSSSSSFESSIGDANANETISIDVVEHVTDLSRYHEIDSACCTSDDDDDNSSTLIIKFTAEWCKPCKSIQPTYLSLASIYGSTATANEKKCTFITLDADGDDCDTLCTQYKIIMMPTFICLKNGIEVGRMTGGGAENGKKLCDWVEDMCS